MRPALAWADSRSGVKVAMTSATWVWKRLRIDLASLPTRFPYQLITPQYETETVLRDRAMRAGVRFEWQTEVTEVSQGESQVEVTASGRGWRARYVVGADGSHSAVREAIGQPFPGGTAVRSMMLADVRFADHPEAVLRADAAESGFAFHVPFGDGWYRVIAWNRDDDRPAGSPLDLDDVRVMLRRVYGTDHGMHEGRWLSRFRADERQVTRYRIGRVLLVGDAAHVHTPAGGQGMNTSLQDAANLHRAVGRRVPDLPLADGGRLYSALRAGQFVLVRSGARTTSDHGWRGPITEVAPATPLRADLLVRPDGHLAWTSG